MISVCMASFNGAKYIEDQVASILKQLGSNDELIISDDGSTDGTTEIIRFLDDPRIQLVKNTKIKGYTGNFENALKLATGEIIFLSDQDDIWHDDKVKSILPLLEDNDFVITDASVVNEELDILTPSYFQLRKTKFGFLNSLIRCRYLGCCYAFKRNVLAKSLPFPSDHEMLPHDLWLALVAEFFFRVKYLKTPLIDYRRHDFNVSSGGEVSGNTLGFKIKFRIYALFNIMKALYVR
jgi:glycosyltransferase involved in cell wall biosynthesis